MASSKKPRILVIDDDRVVLRMLERLLLHLGFEVVTVEDGRTGIERYLENAFDVALVDIRMPEMDGIEVLRQLVDRDENVSVVMMTGYQSVETAAQAIKAGAVDYLIKPMNQENLAGVLNKALEARRQALQRQRLEEQNTHQERFEGMIGVSPAMQQVFEKIRQVADSDTNVLLQGETGTGKELVARAIHNRGGRWQKGFLAINCGAVPETILESELFGHERGAFTGADRLKYGLIEQAEGGTLFLDEVDAMHPALQVKLLRAIQEREVLRVGGERPIPVDFRLIAATNANLRQLVVQEHFREDLFYRLSVAVINLPPLRERKGCLPLLADHFAEIYAQKNGKIVPKVTREALMVMRVYPWPGNVRELENTIEHVVLFGKGSQITIGDLPKEIVVSAVEPVDSGLEELSFREARKQFERRYLEKLLDRTEGKVAEAAKRAGISTRHFYDKMKQYNISLQ